MRIIIFLASLLSINAFATSVYTCIGDNVDFTFNVTGSSSDMDSYWEDIKINGKTLSTPNHGEFEQLSGRHDVWVRGDHWVQVTPDIDNPNSRKFVMTIKDESGSRVLRQIQAKCKKKD